MRLTPKSLFFALVCCGLPLAVTIGWVLGAAATATPPAATAPGGIGGIGAAPERNRPVNPVDYPERTSGARSPSSTAPVAVRPTTTAPSDPPSSAVPTEPPLSDPPASDPTTVPSESTPSTIPAASPSAEPSRLDLARVVRNS